jgi:hypothetical protein
MMKAQHSGWRVEKVEGYMFQCLVRVKGVGFRV